jgi:hypothetical protein
LKADDMNWKLAIALGVSGLTFCASFDIALHWDIAGAWVLASLAFVFVMA